MFLATFLSACWDEKLFKNLSVVSLVGFEGKMGSLTAYYSYPQTLSEELSRTVIIGKGASPRDVRQSVEYKTEQSMDISALSTLLISEETVQGENIYDYLDLYYRDVHNPITPRLALVQGDMESFFDITKDAGSSTGDYYNRLIKSLEENSFIIPYNMQTASTILFENAQDLTLAILKIDEEGKPAGNGVALFSNKTYSGKKLEKDEGAFLNILNDSIGKTTRLTYLKDDKPVSITVAKMKRKISVDQETIDISIKIDVNLSEYPDVDLKKREERLALQRFLQIEIEKDLQKVMEKLQEAKCDAIGLGRIVRAFHTKYFEKDWNDKFAELSIPIKVEVEIVNTGILY